MRAGQTGVQDHRLGLALNVAVVRGMDRTSTGAAPVRSSAPSLRGGCSRSAHKHKGIPMAMEMGVPVGASWRRTTRCLPRGSASTSLLHRLVTVLPLLHGSLAAHLSPLRKRSPCCSSDVCALRWCCGGHAVHWSCRSPRIAMTMRGTCYCWFTPCPDKECAAWWWSLRRCDGTDWSVHDGRLVQEFAHPRLPPLGHRGQERLQRIGV